MSQVVCTGLEAEEATAGALGPPRLGGQTCSLPFSNRIIKELSSQGEGLSHAGTAFLVKNCVPDHPPTGYPMKTTKSNYWQLESPGT